jgi:hypothetical protein
LWTRRATEPIRRAALLPEIQADSEESIVSAYKRLDDLSIVLPELTPPLAALLSFIRSGNLLFLAGYIAKSDGKAWIGQSGANLSIEQGKSGARNVAINPKGRLQAAVDDLNRIRRIGDTHGACEQNLYVH